MMNAMKQRQWESGHEVVHLARKVSRPSAAVKSKAIRIVS